MRPPHINLAFIYILLTNLPVAFYLFPCSIITHGAAAFLKERLMDHSDAFRCHVCDTCGMFGVADLKKRTYHCKYCDANKCEYTLVQVYLPYACKLLIQELMSMNVAPRLLFNSSIM